MAHPWRPMANVASVKNIILHLLITWDTSIQIWVTWYKTLACFVTSVDVTSWHQLCERTMKCTTWQVCKYWGASIVLQHILVTEEFWFSYHSLEDFSKDNVSAIKPLSFLDSNEELGSVGIFSSISHGKPSSSIVLQLEVLIIKTITVDTLACIQKWLQLSLSVLPWLKINFKSVANWVLTEFCGTNRSWDMAFLGRPPGQPVSQSR